MSAAGWEFFGTPEGAAALVLMDRSGWRVDLDSIVDEMIRAAVDAERAAIIDWLCKMCAREARRMDQNGPSAIESMIALSGAASAIERGEHVAAPSREEER